MRKILTAAACILLLSFSLTFSATNEGIVSYSKVSFMPELEIGRTLGIKSYLRAGYELCLMENLLISCGLSIQFPGTYLSAYRMGLFYRDILGIGLTAGVSLLNRVYLESGFGENHARATLEWLFHGVHITGGLSLRFMNTNTAFLWNIFDYGTPDFLLGYIVSLGYRFDLLEGALSIEPGIGNYEDMTVINSYNLGYYVESRLEFWRPATVIIRISYRNAGVIDLTSAFLKLNISAGAEVRL